MNAFDDPTLPRFCGGAIGFLGYDTVRFMEDIPDSHDALDFPDTSFMIPGTVLVHDNVEQCVTIVHWIDSSAPFTQELLYQEAQTEIQRVAALLNQPVPEHYFEKTHETPSASSEFTSNMTPASFHEMVNRAKEYIRAGDIFQVAVLWTRTANTFRLTAAT